MNFLGKSSQKLDSDLGKSVQKKVFNTFVKSIKCVIITKKYISLYFFFSYSKYDLFRYNRFLLARSFSTGCFRLRN